MRPADEKAPFSALVFKIMTDSYVGQLAFVRVYSGVLKAGGSVYNIAKRRSERVGRLLEMHANKREDVESVRAGDIVAVVGLKTVQTGDTVCDADAPVVLERIDFPTPVISLAVEPRTKADQQKIGMALGKLAQEDPTFRVVTDPDTGADDSVGNGRVASGYFGGSTVAGISGFRQCRQAAGGLSRNASQEGCRRGPFRAPIGAAAASTGIAVSRSSRIRTAISSL